MSQKDNQTNISIVPINQRKNDFNILCEQNEIYNHLNLNKNIYYVNKYSINSEEYTHIKKIIPLEITPLKRITYITLNIITFGIINLFMRWFPKLKSFIRYNVTTLFKATYLGIYGMDGVMNIKKIKKIIFPFVDLEKDSIISNLGFNLQSNKNAIMFEYKSYDYIFNEKKGEFEILDYRIKNPKNKILNIFSGGLYPNEVDFLKLIFGKCDIDMQITNFKKILLNELSDPFYLFQLYSVILWILTDYYLYSVIVIILTLASLFISIKETYSNLKKIEELSKYSCPVNIYRKDSNGNLSIQKLSSLELVPGDLFEVPDEGISLPCDSFLVKGSVVLNESMLTGESTPIIKTCLENTDEIFDSKLIDNNKYILFSGTKILQKQNNNKKEKILAVVCDTGFRTFKGQMLSSVIFPKEEDEDFRHDSLKYIIFMVIICFIGYFASLKYLMKANVSYEELILRFFELFTSAVPPSLPTCLSLGMSYSLYRLKKHDIFCINRERVNLLGTINTIVFDKTGTLTENFLDINGFIPTIFNNKLNKFQFDEFSSTSKNYYKNIEDYLKIKKDNKSYANQNKDLIKSYFECLTCCHCLSIINNKIIGDPIDEKMFENTEWILKDKQSENGEDIINDNNKVIFSVKPKESSELNGYQIDIYKRFDFNSNLQRMSVIGKDVNEDYFKVFCKGSPEKIKNLCIIETIPKNFDDLLDSYTTIGYRVLAMAFQYIKVIDITKIDLIQRDKVENKMIFLGFLIVTNKLKADTKDTIINLDKADLRMIMATGDNILTAISVSKECNIVQKGQEIFTLELEKDEIGKEFFFWDKINDNRENAGNLSNFGDNEENNNTDEDNYKNSFEERSLISIFPPKEFSEIIISQKKGKKEKRIKEINENNDISTVPLSMSTSRSRRKSVSINLEKIKESQNQVLFIEDSSPLNISKTNNYSIAITGETFSKLSELNNKYLFTKQNELLKAHQIFRLVLKNGNVFARMNPQHKALLVESLKSEGLNPLMCGDGSNDCLALRKANVGVSLSVEEASIAAHFTSLHGGINCLIHLLKEGKCSLAASIQVFKFVMLDSMTQFISVTLVMIYRSYFSDFQFLLGDLIISFPVVSFYLVTDPANKLTHKYPISGILTFPVLISISLQMAYVFFFQFCGNLMLKLLYKWETKCGFIKDTFIPLPCEENTILFIISHYQFISSAIAFCTSKPFRQRIYKKPYQVIYYIVLISYSIWFTINCDKSSRNIFMLYDFESHSDRYENKIISISMLKYILFSIVVINSIIGIITERVLVKYIQIFWNRNNIKKYKNEISKENNLLNQNEFCAEIPLVKYQEVYFYERRHRKGSKSANINNKKNDGKTFIELITNSNNTNNINNVNQ